MVSVVFCIAALGASSLTPGPWTAPSFPKPQASCRLSKKVDFETGYRWSSSSQLSRRVAWEVFVAFSFWPGQRNCESSTPSELSAFERCLVGPSTPRGAGRRAPSTISDGALLDRILAEVRHRVRWRVLDCGPIDGAHARQAVAR